MGSKNKSKKAKQVKKPIGKKKKEKKEKKAKVKYDGPISPMFSYSFLAKRIGKQSWDNLLKFILTEFGSDEVWSGYGEKGPLIYLTADNHYLGTLGELMIRAGVVSAPEPDSIPVSTSVDKRPIKPREMKKPKLEGEAAELAVLKHGLGEIKSENGKSKTQEHGETDFYRIGEGE